MWAALKISWGISNTPVGHWVYVQYVLLWHVLVLTPHNFISHIIKHRPHFSQVTRARCTEVAARQSWAEYSSRPTTDSRHQGWAIKYFSVIIKIRSICEQPFYDIIIMILHINKSFVLISNPNLQMFVKSIKKFPMLRGTRAAFLLPARTCWMVMGQLLQPQRLPYMARMTQQLLTCGEQVTKIWSTNLHCAEA